MAGIRAWTPAGVQIVDTSTILRVHLGTLELGAGSPASGSITDPDFAGRDIFCYAFERDTSSARDRMPVIQISPALIEWAYPTAFRPPVTILYGVE